MNTWKVIQRKIYDLLSHKYFLLVLFPCLALTVLVLSLIQAGEVWNIWLENRQHGSHTSNLVRSCSDGIEIDVVYTWVNGSDPFLIDDLKVYKDENEEIERWAVCPYPDCEPSHIVLYRSCDQISGQLVDRLPAKHKIETGPTSLNLASASLCKNDTSNLIYFSTIEDASKVLSLKRVNGTLSQGFWTTEHKLKDSLPAPEWIRLSGLVPKFFSLPVNVMKKMLSKHIHFSILEIWPNAEHSFVILKLPSSQAVDQILLKSRVLSLAGDLVVVSRISVVFNTPLKSRFDHYAPSRFEDKEELRYSLRSLEKHAPWIRHVYLVTNGQIPHWLDLDNPRITLVTHKDIFPNQSHLPTFSSPAIESHLHRIRGLSSKFLYLNDDIMFTQNVWPEDFFTNSKGYKVYLSWPVPDCSPTCLWSWVADGSCDSECNVVECGFDGGDCNETDSSPNSLKLRMPRDEFSVYDDLYDLGFENTDQLLRDMADTNFNNLQPPPPGFSQDDLKGRLKKAALEIKEEDDHLIKPREPFGDYDNMNYGVRQKRAAVKKNLGSHSYRESSMIAGQAADFPGAVTISESEINEALLNAKKPKEAERPRHRSPFPQMEMNETLIFRSGNFQENGIEQIVVDHGQNASFIENGTERKPRPSFKGGFWNQKLMRNSSFNQPSNLIAGKHRTGPITAKVHSSVVVNASTPKVLPKRGNGGKGYSQVYNLTRAKQLLHSQMEHDLNESADQTLMEKENQRQIWYGKSKHRILDSFAESLLYVNMMYNKEYGFETRRVPAHAPHLIEKHIMSELQERFPREWDETSSHKLRSPVDMQFAFSYFYFLMSEEVDVTVEELFKSYDTDQSGTWSDREIRTLMTRLYPAPLNPHHLLQFEDFVLNCARKMPSTEATPTNVLTPMYERYQDSPLPTVTWELVNSCSELKKIMLTNLGKRKKYSYEVVREWSKDVTFKMLHSNVSHLVGHLDDIRRNPKKFVCLNDNLDPKQEDENAMVRAVLRDFYHSFFPLPSQFELPLDMRNRFLHVSELEGWKESRAKLRVAAILAVITLCLLTFAVVCPDELRHYSRRIFELSFCLQRRRISRTRCKSRSPVRTPSGSRSV
ncbi:N-acetylglucosamine-1-phosphotransferase subunits alpha/beta [Thrips palmi]|uniref:N-acetylglucosamine-1-phosphotransferase subunits alpha/beta n=1 Tax=Thrips palmi TaxID=161013 RepID=A0A6P8ZIN1_THRPL|nr:N-acetylglucosamine-1-phosphotransferase subunits alpha/beta [Thrips palmi]